MNEIFNYILGYILLIGIIGSYIPQYIKIIRAKSSFGISDLFLFIGYLGSIASFNNALIFYYPEWEKCQGFFDCNTRLLGLIQLSAQCLCFFLFYLFFIIYYDELSKVRVRIFFIIGNLILIGGTTATFLMTKDQLINIKSLDMYADGLSAIVITATSIQYLPQIIKTFLEKSPGNLSLITLAIQCPGSFIWTIFLAVQDNSNPSTWIPYLVTACLQLFLLIMGTILYRRHKVNKQRYQSLIETFA